MGLVRSYLWPDFDDNGNALLAARKRLTHVMCLLSGTIMGFYAYGELMVIVQNDLNYSSVIPYLLTPPILFVLAGLVAKDLFVRGASAFLILLMYSFTLTMRLDTGFFVPGAVYFIAIPMVGGMLLGFRAGIGLSLLVIATYAGLYIFRHDAPPPARIISEDEFAMQSAISFSVLGTTCAASALFFMSVMEAVIQKLHQANDELNAYKQNLEKLVEDRTRTIRSQAEELEVALDAQKQANALQNSLVSVVSHEIRTPLAVIDGSARRMSRKADAMDSKEIAQRSDAIRKNVERLTQLVERTLESARYAEGAISLQCKPFNLKGLIDEVCDREKERTQFHVFHKDLSALPDEFYGDPNMLYHVFSNIVSNAMKYAPDNPAIQVRTDRSAHALTIRIRDHGVGIPAEELPRITNRFFRASTSHGFEGTGVGLFLSNRIIEDHGGSLNVSSEQGKWTEISVTLPIRQANQLHSAA